MRKSKSLKKSSIKWRSFRFFLIGNLIFVCPCGICSRFINQKLKQKIISHLLHRECPVLTISAQLKVQRLQLLKNQQEATKRCQWQDKFSGRPFSVKEMIGLALKIEKIYSASQKSTPKSSKSAELWSMKPTLFGPGWASIWPWMILRFTSLFKLLWLVWVIFWPEHWSTCEKKSTKIKVWARLVSSLIPFNIMRAPYKINVNNFI